MGLFPMFVDLKGRLCLVYGGGQTACRKIRSLQAAGAKICVWSKEFCPKLQEISADPEGHVLLLHAPEEAQNLWQEAFLVVCATDDPAYNHQIAQSCRKAGIWVNSVSDSCFMEGEEPDSDFVFPAMVRRGNLSIGISTLPAVPSLSGQIRTQIEEDLPDWYGNLAAQLALLRRRLRACEGLDQEQRGQIMGQLTQYGIAHEGKIPDDVYENFVRNIKKADALSEKANEEAREEARGEANEKANEEAREEADEKVNEEAREVADEEAHEDKNAANVQGCRQ